MAIINNSEVAVVLDVQHRTPGNLRAFVQATLRSIRTGKSANVRFSSTEPIEIVPMNVRKMDFSYKDGEDFVFSDPETYETVNMPPELVGDASNYLVENGQVTVTFVESKARNGCCWARAARPRGRGSDGDACHPTAGNAAL